MSDRSKLEQMLEHLVNENREKAEELFHELVVAKSREIYENLLDDDIQVEETDDEDLDEASDDEDLDEASDDEDLDEASDDEDLEESSDEEVDEMFGMNELGGDPADDMMSSVEVGADDEGGEMDDMMSDEGGDEPATKDDVLDIKDALEELKADFEAMLAGEAEEDEEEGEEGDDEMDFGGDDEEEKKEDYVREYTEKKTATMGDNGANAKSVVAGKNDMGGTTANIAKSFSTEKGGTQGGLANPNAKDMSTGNVNKVGGTNAKAFYSKDSKGHGVEKKGSGDNGANTKSLIGGKK